MSPTPDPLELRFVESGDVYKQRRLAGRLTREHASVRFEYDERYLADPGAPAVATTLRRVAGPVRSGSAGAVLPFFAGLLPEGRRFSALQRAVKTSADDELTLLLAVGADTIGDVQVVPVGTSLPDEIAAVDVDDWSTTSFRQLYTEVTGEQLEPARASLPGVQVKLSARMITLPVARQHERFILKLDPPEFPHLVANEAFFLDAARQSGLAVAAAEVVHDTHDEAGLLVKRFDRVALGEGGTLMLAQEDACQVLGRYPADKYQLASEDVVTGLARVTQAPLVAARDLLRQFAFAYLTGNGDAHAKNFSALSLPSGEWRVSPAYDVPTSYLYGDTTLALPLGGKLDERIGRADFVAFGERAGVLPRATERLLDQLVERVDAWLPGVDALPFDAHVLHKFRRSIDYRRRRLSR